MNTLSNLLGYYVTGNKNKQASYQATACQLLNLPPTTPIIALAGIIPQLAQVIARCEGYGKPDDVGTMINNPGNILWANQPNAVAFKAVNGYTYAKFATVADGYIALETLLQHYLLILNNNLMVNQLQIQDINGTLQVAMQAATPAEFQALCLVLGLDPTTPPTQLIPKP